MRVLQNLRFPDVHILSITFIDILRFRLVDQYYLSIKVKKRSLVKKGLKT